MVSKKKFISFCGIIFFILMTINRVLFITGLKGKQIQSTKPLNFKISQEIYLWLQLNRRCREIP